MLEEAQAGSSSLSLEEASNGDRKMYKWHVVYRAHDGTQKRIEFSEKLAMNRALDGNIDIAEVLFVFKGHLYRPVPVTRYEVEEV